MTARINFFLFILFLGILVTISCNEDEDPTIPNPEEIITTLHYTLTPTAGGDVVVLTFQDLDGDGGNAPIITGGTLFANSTYTGAIELLNESEFPGENITTEVQAEAVDHQFFFASTVQGLSVAYNDQDTDGNPLGLQTILTTGTSGTGKLTVTLRHQPDKSASGVADGDITNAGGETDIEVQFDLIII